MRNFTALLLASSFLSGSLAFASEPDSGPSPSTSKVVSIPDPGADANLDPGQSLSAARGLFLQVDVAAAAAKIRQGSREFRETARNAASDTRQSLIKAADDLEDLGRRVEARGVKTVEELDKPFARAFHALARHQIRSGQQHWQLRERHQAGYRLRTAADNLERLASTTGHRLSSAANETVRESRLVSGKLLEGAGYATDEVGKTFESLGKHVEAAGRNVEPEVSRKPGSSTQ